MCDGVGPAATKPQGVYHCVLVESTTHPPHHHHHHHHHPSRLPPHNPSPTPTHQQQQQQQITALLFLIPRPTPPLHHPTPTPTPPATHPPAVADPGLTFFLLILLLVCLDWGVTASNQSPTMNLGGKCSSLRYTLAVCCPPASVEAGRTLN